MLQINGFNFHDYKALISRIVSIAQEGKKEIVFLVGAPLTAPPSQGIPGVANVIATTGIIRDIIAEDEDIIKDFDTDIHESDNAYQAAFTFLQGHRGQDTANRVVRQAVLQALKTYNEADVDALSEDEGRLAELDDDPSAWVLSPAVQALGELVATVPTVFGRGVVTSNFDPLIEIAIRLAGGIAWRTVLYSDGDLTQSKASGCQVIHIHGYWHGSDTLHTNSQLLQNRTFLKNSLLEFLAGKTVVVVAYGGWNDIFTNALGSLINNTAKYPEILWTFFDKTPTINQDLHSLLRPGVDRGRVILYSDVDCNRFLPDLLARFTPAVSSTHVPLELPFLERITHHNKSPNSRGDGFPLAKQEGDRPPNIDIWVGRDAELRSLETSKAKVISICGIGGQGKSVLAAHYLKFIARKETPYKRWDWRDCKEEGDRLRTQLIAAVNRSTATEFESAQILSLADDDIVEFFISASQILPTVYVFDNVDHYVDLERGIFVGLLDLLVRRFCLSNSESRIIITCRPRIDYDISGIISFILAGLSFDETVELFASKIHNCNPNDPDIRTAHELTKGHPYWLDLIAIQVGRVPGVTIRNIIDDIQRGRSGIPDFLNTIWKTLPEREHILLRAMAETVRPESESLLQQITSSELNSKNFRRALKMLVQLNLIVVKPESNAPDLYDLHPIMRQFVRRTFERSERLGFIKVIIKQYSLIIKGVEKALGVHLPFPMLERWSQKVELEVEAGLYEQAFATLHDVQRALIGSGNSEEYVRVARKLFAAVDWMMASNNFKHFDFVLAAFIDCLDGLEEYESADDILRRYEETVPARTSRYIGFCNVKSNSEWVRGQFDSAIEWATIGVDLKRNSNVDTEFDCEHILALALRDNGDPDKALAFFLQNWTIETLVKADLEDDTVSAPLFGNVGRCLQIKNDHHNALEYLRISARILEEDASANRVSNQAYARQWIGESFDAIEEPQKALAFYSQAEEILRSIAPARARVLTHLISKLPSTTVRLNALESRRMVRDWIYKKS